MTDESPDAPLYALVAQWREHIDAIWYLALKSSDNDSGHAIAAHAEALQRALSAALAARQGPQENASSSGEPQPTMTVYAHFVIGGWRRDVADRAGLARAVRDGIEASPVAEVSVVRHGQRPTGYDGKSVE